MSPLGSWKSNVVPVESLVTLKAMDGFCDDVHHRRQDRPKSAWREMKTAGSPAQNEATCLRCRQFGVGSLQVKSATASINE
jgi:hypothetical protein